MATSIQEKITKARDAGYNDDEIVKFLGETPDFGPKLKTAIDAGYKSDEILSYLSQPSKEANQPSQSMLQAAQREAQAGLGEGMPQPGMRTSRVISEAPFKALTGAADVFVEAPLNVLNLAKAGYGTITTALGRPDLAPDITPSPRMAYTAAQRAGIISPEETQAQMTPTQRYLDVGVQGATGALMGGKVPTPAAAGRMATVGGLSSMAGQGVAEATGSPTAGILFTPLAAAGSAAAMNKLAARQTAARNALIAQQEQNAVMEQTLRNAQDLGYQVPRSYYTPGRKPGIAEKMAGGIEKDVAITNQATANRAARQALSLDENAPLTTDTMRQIRSQEYNSGYKPIESVGKIRADQQYQNDLDSIRKQFGSVSQSFPKAAKDEVKRIVDAYDELSFNSKDAMKQMRSLREDASANFKNGNTGLAKAQKSISDALENRIERQLSTSQNPNAAILLRNFQESRKRMAMTHAVEDSLVEGTGSINARKLAEQLDKGLTGELKTTAELASAAPKLFPEPSNIGALKPPSRTSMLSGAQATNLMARLGGLTAGGGYMAGPKGALLGAGLSVTPDIASAIARNRALAASKTAPQRLNALSPTEIDPNILNMLMPAYANVLQQQ
jgi:hypothetical protein